MYVLTNAEEPPKARNPRHTYIIISFDYKIWEKSPDKGIYAQQ